MRSLVLAGLCVATLSSVLFTSSDAGACAVFQPPTPMGEKVAVVTDHRMVISLAKDQTTIYDQVQYSGDPKQFAWVIPVSGIATVGTSSDALFGALDTLTEPIVEKPADCPPPPDCSNPTNKGDYGGSDAGTLGGGGVEIVKQEVVGPYDTVQIKSTSATALYDWLTTNGYFVPDTVKPLFDAYIAEKFDFLALKLSSKQGVQAMRPVRVTVPGVSPALPLRAVSAGTGASVGITLWVVGEGRYEPRNFPWFEIPSTRIVWDYAADKSNYLALRASEAAKYSGRGWELESSISSVQGGYVGGALPGVVRTTLGRFVSDYAPTGMPNDIMAASKAMDDDLGTIFHGMSQPRLTRYRADLSHDALAKDLVLTASAQQGEVSPTRSVSNPRQCTPYRDCSGVGPALVGGGCAITQSPSPSGMGFGDLVFVVGVAFIGIGTVRRRRRRA